MLYGTLVETYLLSLAGLGAALLFNLPVAIDLP